MKSAKPGRGLARLAGTLCTELVFEVSRGSVDAAQEFFPHKADHPLQCPWSLP
jgi:hypothetical protein